MQKSKRPNRKGSDYDIIRLNSVGLSLATIAKILDCHPTTVTARLKSLGVEPADTRRTFMEDIFHTLSVEQRDWLADQLGAHLPIKEYIRVLILQSFYKSKTNDHSQHTTVVQKSTSNPQQP